MSTATKEHVTTISPQQQELQLIQSIHHYQLEDWVATVPGGFQTLRLLSDWKIALLNIKLVVLMFTLLKAYSELQPEDSGWFTVLTLVLVALTVFVFIFGLTRKVIFDLENGEVRVTLLGSTISRKRLQGYVSLSHRYGNTLYLELDDQNKIRIANLGAGKELDNLEQFILEALAMRANDAEKQPDVTEQEVVAQNTPKRLPIDPMPPVLTLEALRNAVRNDTGNHPIKKLAELLVMALNDWPRDMLEIEDTIKEMKVYFGEPMTVERLKGKRFDYSMPFNSWRLEAGASLWQMLELSTKLENESDFDEIVARILDYYGSCESREVAQSSTF